MIRKKFYLVFNLNDGSTIETGFKVVQNDVDAYTINAVIFDGSAPIDYELISSATITYEKPDGKIVQRDMTVESNMITCIVKSNEISVLGVVKASIQLYGEDDERLSLLPFTFEVTKDMISPPVVESTNEFPILQKLVQDVHTIIPMLPEIQQIAFEMPGIIEFFDAAEVSEVQRVANENTRQAQEAARQASIADIINQFNNLVTAKQQEAEVIIARDGEANLKARLDRDKQELSSQMAEKAAQSDLEMLKNSYSKFDYPSEFSIPEEFKIDLFKNGCTYETNFDIRTKRIKNGGKTYYVSPNGSDSNDGLTIGTPLKGIDTAVAKSDVETIILLEGNYYLDENWTTQIVINKSLNIIGKGNVRIINAKKVTWTVHDTYPNVYHISPTPANFNKVVSLDVFDEYGDELELTKKTSLASEVANIPFSYAVGSNLYMHLSETPTDDNVAVLLGADAPILVTDSVGKTQIKLYMENIKILGGRCCIELITQSDQVQDNYFYGYKCKFLHSHNENAFQGLGGNYYLVECVASYGDADGFNYHMNTKAKKPYAIEINCIGRNNGQGIGETSNQGSTIHDGGSIIRVNGEYYLNQGGNITDAYAMSVNLNCKAYNSRITDPTRAGNFVAIKGAASPAKLWVINCLSFGNVYDLIVDGDMTYSAVIYERNNQLLCGQNNMIGTGQIVSI